jgi:DNA-binding NtrC family response regulator
VLLVDDEQDLVGYLAKRLAARKMQVSVVHDGLSALEAASAQSPDVVVLDMLMPGMDGLETLEELKRVQPDLPVIMLSGHGEQKSAEEGQRRGAVEYLLKPCDFGALHEAIVRAVG